MNILRINNIPHNSIIKTNLTLPSGRLEFLLSMSFLQISLGSGAIKTVLTDSSSIFHPRHKEITSNNTDEDKCKDYLKVSHDASQRDSFKKYISGYIYMQVHKHKALLLKNAP